MRQYKPEEVLDASNSRVTGLSTDRYGRITQIRVRVDLPTREQAKILFKDKGVLNPINIPAHRLGL